MGEVGWHEIGGVRIQVVDGDRFAKINTEHFHCDDSAEITRAQAREIARLLLAWAGEEESDA